MRIVDAQVHIWQSDNPDRPWPPGNAGRAHRPVPLEADGLLQEMDSAGVERAILVPPSWEGDRNDLSIAAARRHPGRFGVMGRLSLTDPDSRERLKRVREDGMLGLRFTFHTDQQKPWLTDGTADWLWPAAEKAGVPLTILPPGSIAVVDAIAERHPGLRLTIDHLAMSSKKRDEAAFADLPDLLRLARRPNVNVKATCLPGYSTQHFPFPDLQAYIRRVYDAFGPKRLFWGSDLSRLPCPYRECISLFTEQLDWLSEDDKADIMGRAICSWLDWPFDNANASMEIRS